MGYRDGITEGQKDSAQEGFNVGFRQSVDVGYKWGLVRGVTRYILLRIDFLYCHSPLMFPLILTFLFVCYPSSSALASLPDSLKEKLVPDAQCRRKLWMCRALCKKYQQMMQRCSMKAFVRVVILQRNHM